MDASRGCEDDYVRSLNDTQADVTPLDSELAEPRALYYQPWLMVRGERLAALVDEVFSAIPPPPVSPGRSPRKDAAERRKLAVSNLLANLTVLALSPLGYDTLLLSFHRSARDRYNRADFTIRVMEQMVYALQYLGIVSVAAGAAQKTLTRVSLKAGFRENLRHLSVSLLDVGIADTAETILLRARGQRDEVGELLPYEDTPLSDAMREEMVELNAGLNGADIRLSGEPIGPVHMVRIFQDCPTAPWSRHGRLYRAVHLSLPKERRYLLTMGGSELADLDWKSCHLRIAYAMEGIPAPEGDLYAIPGLEDHRDAVKDVVSAFFSRRPPALERANDVWTPRLPRGCGMRLPHGWSGQRFHEALSKLHPGIAHLFGKPDLCFTFMFLEAKMLLDVLRRLRSQGCIALPAHDGLLVKVEHRELAASTMEAVSHERLGTVIPVAEKPIVRPAA